MIGKTAHCLPGRTEAVVKKKPQQTQTLSQASLVRKLRIRRPQSHPRRTIYNNHLHGQVPLGRRGLPLLFEAPDRVATAATGTRARLNSDWRENKLLGSPDVL